MTTDPRIAVLSALSSPDWHPIPEAHGMPWGEAEQLLAAYDASRAVVPAVAPATDQAALRARLVSALDTAFQTFVSPLSDAGVGLELSEHLADAVLSVLPAPADRAAVLREAADAVDSGKQPFPEAVRSGASWAARMLRRMADEAKQPERDCPSCEAGLAHTEHCPTPETHNAGCGCPSDVAAAVASCPGYEMSPSPCRCPCYGCKHHCAGHDPAVVEVQQPSLGAEDCTCIPFTRQGGVQRYCQPGDTVDMISGWEIGGDCPHHRDAVKAQQPKEA